MLYKKIGDIMMAVSVRLNAQDEKLFKSYAKANHISLSELFRNAVFEKIEDGKQGMIQVTLKYDEKGKRVISGLKRISKPGLRIYVSCEELPQVLNGLGIALVSTSKGIKTDRDARREGLGGEVLAYVW